MTVQANNFSITRGAGLLAMVVAAGGMIWISSICALAQTDTATDAPTGLTSAPLDAAGAEHFVPASTVISCEGTLEMQKLAQVTGSQIRVRQVVRWSEADSASFAAIADIVIDRFDGKVNRKLSLDELRNTLSGAGVNLAMVRFAGATSCLVSRADNGTEEAAVDDHGVVQQWLQQKTKPEVAPTSQPATVSGSDVADAECGPFRTLRDRMLIDLSQRLNLPIDELEMTFDAKDRNLLNLSEPLFRFQLDPRRVRDLGKVSWDVTIMTGQTQKTVTMNADAREWERELVLSKAANFKQVLRDDDLTERRVLVDHVSDDQVLTRTQIVGQQASRDLKPGTVLTARLIDPVPLARLGQYVTITLNEGGVQVKTVAKAMESGSYGQTIKVKSEQTQDVFDVTLTGPQVASMGPTAGDAKLASDRD